MKCEDAFYYKNLLLLGFSDGYDEWLDSCLEKESPLSDVVLDLSLCGSDRKKTISVLHNYCIRQNFDETSAHNKLRLFFKEAYHSNRMSKEETVSMMYRLSVNIGIQANSDVADVWGSMYALGDYYCLAKDGIISWEGFDHAFFAYLDHGTPVDFDLIRLNSSEEKT